MTHTKTHTNTHLQYVWAALSDAAPADINYLRAAIDEAPPTYQVRGLILPVVQHGVTQIAPEKLDQFKQFSAHYPPASPFSFVPIYDLLSQLAVASALSLPPQPLWEACNAFTRLQIGELNTLPMFMSILRACEGKWQTFMKLLASSHSLVYSAGKADLEVIHERCLVLHYSDIPGRALSYWAVGYLEGILDTFHVSGRVLAEQSDPRSLSLRMEEA
jgi:hypothetical protein